MLPSNIVRYKDSSPNSIEEWIVLPILHITTEHLPTNLVEVLTCRTLRALSPGDGTVQTVTVPGVITGWLYLMESQEDSFNHCPSKEEIFTCRTLGDLGHDHEGGTVQTFTVSGVITGWLHLMESQEDSFIAQVKEKIFTCRTLGDLGHDHEGSTVQTFTVSGVITGWLQLMESQEDSFKHCPSKRRDIHL